MPEPFPTNRSTRARRPARPAAADRGPQPVVARQNRNPPAPVPAPDTGIGRTLGAIVMLGFIGILLVSIIGNFTDFDSSDSPSLSVPGDQAVSDQPTSSATAYEQLVQQVALDNDEVRSNLAESWVAQLASARRGLVVDGVTFDYSDILAEHQGIRQTYPNTRLVWSGDWSSFSGRDYFVTVLNVPYSTFEQANAWCDSQGIGRDHCFAKLLSNTASSYEETTKHR